MDENPQEANDQLEDGHPIITRLTVADFEEGKRDGYVGAPDWVYDANGMAYREALPEQQNDSISTVVPADHFF